jgi:hypothetical protein
MDKKAAGIPLCRATMRKAEKYGLYQVALDLSRELRNHYSLVDTNTNHYRFYTKKQREYQNELLWELEAEDVFYEFAFKQKKGFHIKDIECRLKGLNQLPAKGFWFHYVKFVCQASFHQFNRQEEAMLATCHEALKYFNNDKTLPYTVRFSFYYRAIAVHLSRKEFPLAESLINKSLDGPAYGQHNWQIIMLHRALLGFHSGKPAIALDAYRKAIKVPKKARTDQVEDQWRIVRAYLELYDVEAPGTWRLSRFLNSLQATNADKAGFQVSVKIVELMHFLKQREFEKYRYRCERLEAYIDHHLKGKELDRYIHFLRLLQCIVRGGFQQEEVIKKGNKYLKALKEESPRIGADVREVEIIPFEMLWEMAIGWL